ncbi:MAG: cupin domain-containing protein [Sphingomonas sp.]|uniref:cupin domain-containing protein n=1 Tax=Sphingomonas sp. TaxID=28214 RepID=UPI0017C068B8|nr:cupin domain-containing protein [Sphingomonas sp.]MBA3668018.1 cupin domain-containing protein [Sphingomonas sp.]
MPNEQPIPAVIDPLQLSRSIGDDYNNRSLAQLNDHEVRMSVMTSPYVWHYHPDSDETFLVVAGELLIEFYDGSVTLRAGQLLTIPKGMPHRTQPIGERSVNLTIEKTGAQTIFK